MQVDVNPAKLWFCPARGLRDFDCVDLRGHALARGVAEVKVVRIRNMVDIAIQVRVQSAEVS